jgi:phosphoribosylglycinamide formyltransferase-1
MISVVVLISGSGSNLLNLLQKSQNPLFPAKLVAVGSDCDAPGLEHAELYEVDTFIVNPAQFESRELWGKTLLANVQHHQPDLVVLAGFMKILPANFVSALKGKLINIHPSLLPEYKGAHAVRDALKAGAVKTGVSVHYVDEGVDTGEIIVQSEVEIIPGDTERSLHQRIQKVEHELLSATIENIAHNQIPAAKL